MYFGENRHPISRKPDTEKDRLAEQNALLKKLLVQQAESVKRHKSGGKIFSPLRKVARSLDNTNLPSQSKDGTPAKPYREQIARWSSITLVIALAATGGILFALSHHSKTLPKDVVRNAGFPLYYPSPLPQGYAYKDGSAEIEGSLVLYTFVNGKSSMTVTEQALPPNMPSINNLSGFTTIQTINGIARVGAVGGRPTSILATNTTLITITGSKGMPDDIVANTTKEMVSLQQ